MAIAEDKSWEQIIAELDETDRQEFVDKFGHLFARGTINSYAFTDDEGCECWLWVTKRGIGTKVDEVGIRDIVTVKASNLEPIPVGGNPFHYDLFRMGTELVRGWMIMHEGNSDQGTPLRYLILINRNTGQRLQLDLLPASPGMHHETQLETLKKETYAAKMNKEVHCDNRV